jgi:hypothetical protein
MTDFLGAGPGLYAPPDKINTIRGLSSNKYHFIPEIMASVISKMARWRPRPPRRPAKGETLLYFPLRH